MSTYPKSPREMAGGMMWFPRLTDKIRLCARGELPEAYHANLGERFDQRCAGFLRVEYPALRARVLAGGTDEEILEWCYENGRRLNDLDLFIWNSFVSKFGWNDERTVRVVPNAVSSFITNKGLSAASIIKLIKPLPGISNVGAQLILIEPGLDA